MTIARSFGPVAQEMKRALEVYSKEELIDLLTHLVKTYVVEGTLPLKPEVSSHKGDEKLSGLTFPQLILHLQMHLEHREWAMFSVSGEDVWVASEGQRINLTGRQTPLPAAAPATQEPAREPAGGYTPAPPRAARPEPSPPAPRSAPPEAPPAAAPTPARPESEPKQEQAEQPAADREEGSLVISDDVEATERFGMLEFD
ncbi:MAG: hypothetical protein JW797_05485 [Bradymonadales bacterium]|nr:hypothetical protein [Bradymonadales bacterium]